MFVLRCKISNYMLQSVVVDKGETCGVKYKSVFTLDASSALHFDNIAHAHAWRDLSNTFSPAPLPYDFGEYSHTNLEAVKIETLEFEAEQQED